MFTISVFNIFVIDVGQESFRSSVHECQLSFYDNYLCEWTKYLERVCWVLLCWYFFQLVLDSLICHPEFRCSFL